MTLRIVALLALPFAACARETPNVDACRAYADTAAALPCAPAAIDADAMCPASFDDDGAADCTALFACLARNARCTDGGAFANGASQCGGCVVRE